MYDFQLYAMFQLKCLLIKKNTNKRINNRMVINQAPWQEKIVSQS